MARTILGKNAVKAIHAAVGALFERAKQRLLAFKGPREIRISTRSPVVGIRHDLSLPGIFNSAATSEGFRPAQNVRESLTRIAEGYLSAHAELAKTRVVNAVQNFLTAAEMGNVSTSVETVLGGELAELMGKIKSNVKTIVETESTRARNAGTLDVITKISAVTSDDEPRVFFVIVRDKDVCDECLRLHQQNGTISGPPRVFKLSEVSHGYHVKGDDSPSMSGIHPHCRCTLVRLAPGYGFDEDGKVAYKAHGHDEFSAQRANEDV